MRIAIVGGPGIGKSTLVRQLGDLYHNGAYGEGEKGVWDPRVLEDIAVGRNPVGVTEYFAALYDANYRDCVAHDAPGRVVFFEGARITLEAHIAEYPAECHAALHRVVCRGDHWTFDRVIVLTSSSATIEKHIRLRNRPHELAENMVRRFRLWEQNAILIDRDGMEFHERSGLDAIVAAAGLPPYPEIPYRDLPC
ncbi:MAG: hypothetical protein U0P82_10165 [Vicinamibacterales bacterium]